MQRKFGRSLNELKNVVAFTDQLFARDDVDASLRYVVDLCVEELFVNMITYDKETREDILIEMRPMDHGIEVRLTDFDVDRFDPRDAPSPRIDAPLDERAPGGLGLYLVMKMADSVRYEYRDRTSRITFVATRK